MKYRQSKVQLYHIVFKYLPEFIRKVIYCVSRLQNFVTIALSFVIKRKNKRMREQGGLHAQTKLYNDIKKCVFNCPRIKKKTHMSAIKMSMTKIARTFSSR